MASSFALVAANEERDAEDESSVGLVYTGQRPEDAAATPPTSRFGRYLALGFGASAVVAVLVLSLGVLRAAPSNSPVTGETQELFGFHGLMANPSPKPKMPKMPHLGKPTSLGNQKVIEMKEESHEKVKRMSPQALKKELSSAAPRLCTDGWVFNFTTTFSFHGKAGFDDIVTSATGAFQLKVGAATLLDQPKISFLLNTYNFGSVSVAKKIERDGIYDLSVAKTRSGMCLTLCEHLEGGGCKASEPKCAYPPVELPSTSFQMREPGLLSWGLESTVMTKGSFHQTEGTLAATMTLDKVPFKTIWNNEDDWEKVTSAVHHALTSVAGHGTQEINTHVTPAYGTDDGGSVFLGTVVPDYKEAGLACRIQDTLTLAFSGDAFNKAVKEKMGAAKLSSGLSAGVVKVAEAAAPGEALPCESFMCRLSNPLPLPEDAQCLGYGCSLTCCQTAWADSPLDYKPGPQPKAEPAEKVTTYDRGEAKVKYVCSTNDKCCQVDAPLGKAPLNNLGPKGYSFEQDWTLTSASSEEDCKKACAKNDKCTGITYQKDQSNCMQWTRGFCDPRGDDGKHLKAKQCHGATTCAVLPVPEPLPPPQPSNEHPGKTEEELEEEKEDKSKPNAIQRLFAEAKSNQEAHEKWLEGHPLLKGIETIMFGDGQNAYPISTDGLTFTFEVTVHIGIGAFATEQEFLVGNYSGIVLKTQPGDHPGKGSIMFETHLQNWAVDDSMGQCYKNTCDLVEGFTYNLTVSRDLDKGCCIEARPAGGLVGHAIKALQDIDFLQPRCAGITPWINPARAQIRPVNVLTKIDSPTVQVKHYTQTAGGLTLSFDVEEVSFEKLTGESECNCLDDFTAAVREAVAYRASVNIPLAHVTAAVKRGWSTSVVLPAQTDEEKVQENVEERNTRATVKLLKLPPKLQKIADQQKKKLAALENGTMWDPDDEDDDGHLTEEDKKLIEDDEEDYQKDMNELAEEEAANATALGTAVRRRLGPPPPPLWAKKLAAAFKKTGDPKFQTATGHSVINVQVTLANCGDCQAELAALQEGDLLKDALVARIVRVTGDGPNGAASTGTVAINEISFPAQPVSCSFFQCPMFQTNDFPFRTCYGGACSTSCCEAAKCAQVNCPSPYVNNPLAALLPCKDPATCGDQCCLMPCSSYKCAGCSVCPSKLAWLKFVPPSKAQLKCCKVQSPRCCNAPIATCLACMNCQSKQAYCESCLHKWTPKGIGRKLSDEYPELPPPDTLTDNDFSGGLPPMVDHDPLDPAELKEDIEAAEESMRVSHDHWPKPERRLSLTAAQARKRRLSADQQSEHQQLLSGMLDAVKEAADYRLKNRGTVTVANGDPGQNISTTWLLNWHKVILQAKARHHGMIAGCEVVTARFCPYHFRSIFLLHRGCGIKPLQVTSVGILTDTFHAVTCGDDGLCWVWKIRSGTPRQVFLPTFSCSSVTRIRPPQLTVSVLYDATFILSAGVSYVDGAEQGLAYIWDWRWGFQDATYTCDLPFLSSAEMPAWRMVILGCADAFTYIWNWAGGSAIWLPYNARTVQEIRIALQSRVENYINNNLKGFERLIAEKAAIDQKTYLNIVYKLDPTLKNKTEFLATVVDFFSKNRFGAVRAIAYTPTRLRFVTGSATGLVRFWDADSGTLLMVMRGHQGPVNAIAPSPKRLQALSGGDDGTVRLWCLKTGVQLMLFYQPYGGPVLSLAVIPGGNKVVVGSADGYVRIWNINSGLLLCAFNTGGGAVRGVAVNPSNPLGQIITANADGYARVFNPR